MVLDKDMVGVLISGVCLVHCLIGPFLIILGVASLGHVHHAEEQQLHLILLIPILIVAAWSIPIGLKKHHRMTPAILSVGGVVFLSTGILFIELSLLFSVVGSVCLGMAHLLNRSLTKKAKQKCMTE